MSVYFVDTSILCNLLPIPGRDQHRKETVDEFREKVGSSATLILPVAAIIEAGNFIAQLGDGGQRRETAHLFMSMLELICADRAPWRLHQFTWGSDYLRTFVRGADTGMDLVQHAVNQMGSGDLSILAERHVYRVRTGLIDVRIWTRDTRLGSHS